jgi:quercetin dioxygenase-like cupin family protein
LLSSLLLVIALVGGDAREARAQEAVPRPVAQELLSRILHDVDGRQVAVTKLVYAPGVASMPHRHQAYLAVYVVSGQVESALDDEAPVLYGPGDVWYESHNQLHRVFRNPSSTEPFTAIVFALRDPDHPAVRASEAERH